MIVNTNRFGQVEADDSQIVVFPEGIPGFPGRQRFILLKEGLTDTPFWWLQSVEEGGPSFLTVTPAKIIPDYDFPIPDELFSLLKLPTTPAVEALAIVSVPDGDLRRATINLKAPVLINPEARLGGQLILEQSPYAIRHPLFSEAGV